MTVGSFCSGIGGFDVAAKECGFTIKYVSEIEKFPSEVLATRFTNAPNVGDFTKINGEDLPPVDIVVGGTPCQSFSCAGKRQGFDGASGIFVDWIKRIKEMKPLPSYVVWENVPGVFSLNKGEDFRKVLELFLRICNEKVNVPKPKKWEKHGVVIGSGYSFAWRVLNAAEMGVPQQRKRVYLVLSTRNERAAEILFEREGLCRNFTPSYFKKEDFTANVSRSVGETISFEPGAASRVGGHVHSDGYVRTIRADMGDNHTALCYPIENHANDGRVKIREDNTTQTLSARMGTGGNNCPLVLEPSGFDGARVYEDATPTLSARQYKDPPCFCIQATTIDRKLENGAAGKGIKTEESYTLNTVDRHAVVIGNTSHGGYKEETTPLRASGGDYGGGSENLVIKDFVIRRITPLECLRLQGFPDTHFDGVSGSDTAKYKACGNSLAVPCALFVLRGIQELENGDYDNLTETKRELTLFDF